MSAGDVVEADSSVPGAQCQQVALKHLRILPLQGLQHLSEGGKEGWRD